MAIIAEIPMSSLDAYVEARNRVDAAKSANLSLPIGVVFANAPTAPEVVADPEEGDPVPVEAEAAPKKVRKPKAAATV